MMMMFIQYFTQALTNWRLSLQLITLCNLKLSFILRCLIKVCQYIQVFNFDHPSAQYPPPFCLTDLFVFIWKRLYLHISQSMVQAICKRNLKCKTVNFKKQNILQDAKDVEINFHKQLRNCRHKILGFVDILQGGLDMITLFEI